MCVSNLRSLSIITPSFSYKHHLTWRVFTRSAIQIACIGWNAVNGNTEQNTVSVEPPAIITKIRLTFMLDECIHPAELCHDIILLWLVTKWHISYHNWQIHLTEPELRICSISNATRGIWKVCNDMASENDARWK